MFKRMAAFFVGALICGVATAQSVDDRIRELERRVEQLEKQVAQPTSPAVSLKPISGQPDGWRQRESWRALKRGMTERDVRSILGEPQKVDSFSSFSFWSYPGGGRAQFGSGERLEGWNEPR